MKRLRMNSAASLGVAIAFLSAASAGARPVAITGAKVWTLEGPAIENGTVVIDSGRITAVGAGLAPPAGSLVVDGKGLQLAPGFVSGPTHLGLEEISQVASTVDYNESADPVSPQARVIDAYNSESAVIPVTRMNGITSAVIVPGTQDVVSGQAAVVSLLGLQLSALTLRAPAALCVTLGEPPKGFWGPKNRSPQTRMGNAAVLRAAFTKARDYVAKWDAYDKKSSSAGSGKGKEATPPDRDLGLDAIALALQGKIPVLITAQRADDIETALRIAAEFKLRWILNGGAEAWKLASRLKEAGVPITLQESEEPDKMETLGARYDNAAILYKAGVQVSFNLAESPHTLRNLPYEAGVAVSYGLPYEEALKALSLNTARMFGVSDQVGSIAVGKQADLVLWDGDPLEPLSRVKQLWIRGEDVPLRSVQTLLRERYEH